MKPWKILLMFVAVLGLSASHSLWSAPGGGNSNQECLCHVNDESSLGGTVICVSSNGNAVNAHLNHGDCRTGVTHGDECDPTDDVGGGTDGDEPDDTCDAG